MPISRMARSLSKPEGGSKIPSPTLAYFRMRTRMRMFTLVRRELRKSGITKAVLAKRLGKGADQINHWLATPQNWTIDTLSDFLLGISGAELGDAVSRPFGELQDVAAEDVAEIQEHPALIEPDTQQSEVVTTPESVLADWQGGPASALLGLAAIMGNTIANASTVGFEQGSVFGADNVINSEMNLGIPGIGSTPIATPLPPTWVFAQPSALTSSVGAHHG
jgi:hypothetical protein